jgi:hypothetical protein
LATDKFLYSLAWITVPLLLTIGGVNYWIDGSSNRHLPSEQRTVPGAQRHSGLSKLHYLANEKPEVVYFGSSRVEVGLPPRSDLVGGLSAYNAGISGSSFGNVVPLIRHAMAVTRPSVLVIGIDFPSFTSSLNPSDVDSWLLSSSRVTYLAKRFVVDVKRALSWDETLVSFGAVRALLKGSTATEPNSVLGQLTDSYMNELISGRGKAALAFKKKIQMSFAPLPSAAETSEGLRLLDDLLDQACHDNVDVRIYIHPRHALAEINLIERGAWPRVEQWKNALGELATKYQKSCKLSILDFSGFNSITSEPVLGLSATRGLRLYWEAAHYKSMVGELILQRLFSPGQHSLPSDFGRELTAATAAQVNATIRAEQIAYFEVHRNEVDSALAWAGIAPHSAER